MARRFIVIGLGKFGSYLAKTLASEGMQVLCIDRNEKLVEEISEEVSEAIVADAKNREVLKNIGIKEAEKIIVAIGSLSASVLIVLYLKELGAKSILAKAIDEDHARILSLLGADRVVIPERDAAIKEARSLVNPNVVDFLPLLPEFLVAQIDPPDEFIGKTLKDLNFRRRFKLYVIAIRNKYTEKLTLLPSADHVIEKEEELFVLGRKENIEKFSSIKLTTSLK